MQQINIGIIGTGRITQRFMDGVVVADAGFSVAAVYNPRVDSAKEFAKKWNVKRVAESLEELFAAVDAVYGRSGTAKEEPLLQGFYGCRLSEKEGFLQKTSGE